MYKVNLQLNNQEYSIHNESIKLKNGVVKLGINTIDSFSFTILPNNIGFNRINDFKTLISVYNEKRNKYEFQGRVLYSTDSMESSGNISKSVICESFLGYLQDSVQNYVEERNWTPEELLTEALNVHNSQMEEEKQFKVGIVELTENIYIGIQRETTWECINKKIIDKVGGEIELRIEDDGMYIDLLSKRGKTRSTTIELSKNMQSITKDNDPSSYITRLIPLGAKLTDEDGNEIEERVDITSVNNGLKYIDDEIAITKYGLHVAYEYWDDVHEPQILKTKATNFLTNNNKVLQKYSINTLDLALLSIDIDYIDVCNYYPVKNELLGIDDILRVITKSIDIVNESSTSIEVGDNFKTLSDLEIEENDKMFENIGKIEKKYQLNVAKINSMEKSINYFSVDLSQYNLIIPTSGDKKPLETKNYDVYFYGYFKGQQITPTISISGSNTGIATSNTNTYIRFAVNSGTAITNVLNEYKVTFTYTVDGTTYTLTKIIDIALALKGSDGTSVNILGSYDSLEELETAHPSGNVGDAYIIDGNMYVWNVENNSWVDVGNIQGPVGKDGADGKSAYQIWLDNGNTGTEEDYLASLKGEQGIQGATGKDGTSYYFYVRYSANSSGNPMTQAPTDTTKYMGVASTTSTTAPTSYSAYTWTLIKGNDGEQGPQGIQGQTGADGKSSYLHIKYSDDGTTFTGNNGEDIGRYRGELVDNNSSDSTTFSDYKWYDMALIVEEELEEIRQEVINNTSLIEQTDTQIRLDVAEEYVSTGTFDEFRETTETQFTVQADGIEAKFSEMTILIEEVENETQTQFRELSSYIRGYQNESGQPVIELGSNTSDIILRQLNDRIQFLQNGVEVAYITNNTLYITDGTFLNSLRIGNFAFIPRTNGSLDFKKVVV